MARNVDEWEDELEEMAKGIGLVSYEGEYVAALAAYQFLVPSELTKSLISSWSGHGKQ